MRRKLLAFIVVIGSAVYGAEAFAHHPFGGIYIENKQITIAGNVTECVYREPHSYVQLLVRDANGHDQRWIVEWRGAADLLRTGVTPSTLRPGQRIVVVGRPSRVAAEFRVRVQTLLRPEDGWRWMEGTD